jgi:hypothetical protein
VRGDQRLQFTDQVRMTAEREVSIDPVLDHTSPHLLQPRDLPLREPLLAHIGQGRTAPERQRLTEVRRSPVRRAILERATALRGQALKTADVDAFLCGTQHVAAWTGEHHRAPGRRLQCLPEPRDVNLQGVLRPRGRMFPPQPIDEHIARHRHVRAEEKDHKQRSLLWAADIQGIAIEADLGRPE